MRLVTWIVFIPPLWACTSAKGLILQGFTHGSRSRVGASLQQHCGCLARGLFQICIRLEGEGSLGIMVKLPRAWTGSLEVQAGFGPCSVCRPEHRTAFLCILGASNHSKSSVLPHLMLPNICHKQFMGIMTRFCQCSLVFERNKPSLAQMS